MGLQEYPTEKSSKVQVYDLKVDVKKEEVIGSYMHPVTRRMRYFYFYHGKEFLHALQRFYELGFQDFNYIIGVTRRFIQLRLQELSNIKSKSRVVNMYQNVVQNFNLLFCRDLFAIMQYKDDFFKFERLENFLSYIYDPSIKSLRDVTLKAFFH